LIELLQQNKNIILITGEVNGIIYIQI